VWQWGTVVAIACEVLGILLLAWLPLLFLGVLGGCV